uniref:Ig-like domain-containing protein n=1 Tax=Castor canadensis TaxID=51338 RepID=A0A8C0WIE2_CASCN
MLNTSLLGAAITCICLDEDGTSMTQNVTQAQTAISVVEKDNVTLDCVYEISNPSYYLFWYKQPPNGEMVFLICQDSYNEQNAKEGHSISLTITATHLGALAVYFCSLSEITVRRKPVRAPHKPSQTGEARLRQHRWGLQGNCTSIHVDV